jgi:hypothetical protein
VPRSGSPGFAEKRDLRWHPFTKISEHRLVDRGASPESVDGDDPKYRAADDHRVARILEAPYHDAVERADERRSRHRRGLRLGRAAGDGDLLLRFGLRRMDPIEIRAAERELLLGEIEVACAHAARGGARPHANGFLLGEHHRRLGPSVVGSEARHRGSGERHTGRCRMRVGVQLAGR